MAVWTAWLLVAAAVCVAADIGWPARIVCFIALTCTYSPYRQFVGLHGERSVLAVGHDARGIFVVLARAPMQRVRTTGVELRRFGNLLWVLGFSSSQGRFSRMICPASQEPGALRRLVRELRQPSYREAPGQFGPRQGSS